MNGTTTLDEAVRVAKLAMVDLVGLMAAEGLTFQVLNLMLEPGWPCFVKDAWLYWTNRMNDVCVCLASQAGVTGFLSQKDREKYTKEAFSMVMD